MDVKVVLRPTFRLSDKKTWLFVDNCVLCCTIKKTRSDDNICFKCLLNARLIVNIKYLDLKLTTQLAWVLLAGSCALFTQDYCFEQCSEVKCWKER